MGVRRRMLGQSRQAFCILTFRVVCGCAGWQSIVRCRVRVTAGTYCKATQCAALIFHRARAEDAAQGVAPARDAHAESSIIAIAHNSAATQQALWEIMLASSRAPARQACTQRHVALLGLLMHMLLHSREYKLCIGFISLRPRSLTAQLVRT